MIVDLFSLTGRTALVTGGSRGIGFMIAKGLLEAGARKVYITGRNAERCHAAAASLGPDCIPLVQDIESVAGCKALAARYAEHETSLDILVNNAGTDQTDGGFLDVSEDAWNIVMDVNVRAPFFLTQALHPALKAGSRGDTPSKVINIASIDGLRLNAINAYAYYASKSGLIFLTRRLAAELIEDGIVVTCIAPGAFASDLNEVARDQAELVATRIPAKRIGREGDIQGAIIYLASKAGDWIVGDTLIVDGGVVMAKYFHPDPFV